MQKNSFVQQRWDPLSSLREERKSYYSEILSEMQLCDANNIQILGMIMLEN